MLGGGILIELRFSGRFLVLGKVARFHRHAHAFQYFLPGFKLLLIGLEFGNGRLVGCVLHLAHRVLYGFFGLRPVHLAHLQGRSCGCADVLHLYRHFFHLALYNPKLALQFFNLWKKPTRFIFEVCIRISVLLRYDVISLAMRSICYRALARCYSTTILPKVAPFAIVVFKFYFFLRKFGSQHLCLRLITYLLDVGLALLGQDVVPLRRFLVTAKDVPILGVEVLHRFRGILFGLYEFAKFLDLRINLYLDLRAGTRRRIFRLFQIVHLLGSPFATGCKVSHSLGQCPYGYADTCRDE